MLRDMSFREALRREAHRIALPPEGEWLPKRSVGSETETLVAVIGGGLAVAAVTIAIALGNSQVAESPAAGQPAVATSPSRPTVVDGRVITPVPVIYSNGEFRYNLVLPAWFRESTQIGSGSDADLLDRKLFTARSEANEAQLGGSQFRPWDLFVEVYRRGDRTAEVWAAQLGCGSASGESGTCSLTTTQINGTSALVAVRSAPLPGKMYLIERGDELLVLRYGIGDESNRPQDVTEATLDQIIGSLGLP